jgi:hypothetical protein
MIDIVKSVDSFLKQTTLKPTVELNNSTSNR